MLNSDLRNWMEDLDVVKGTNTNSKGAGPPAGARPGSARAVGEQATSTSTSSKSPPRADHGFVEERESHQQELRRRGGAGQGGRVWDNDKTTNQQNLVANNNKMAQHVPTPALGGPLGPGGSSPVQDNYFELPPAPGGGSLAGGAGGPPSRGGAGAVSNPPNNNKKELTRNISSASTRSADPWSAPRPARSGKVDVRGNPRDTSVQTWELFVILAGLLAFGLLQWYSPVSKHKTLANYRRTQHGPAEGATSEGAVLSSASGVGGGPSEAASASALSTSMAEHDGNEKLHGSLQEIARVQNMLKTGFVGMIHSTTLLVGGAALNLPPSSVLVLGAASLAGCATAAGLSEYLSQSVERDFWHRERRNEMAEVETELEEEMDEMTKLYQRKGMSPTDAKTMVETVSRYREFFVDHMLYYELHLKRPASSEPDATPARDGFAVGMAYLMFGVLPLLSLSGLFRGLNRSGWRAAKAAFYVLSPLVAFFVTGSGIGSSFGADSAVYPGLAHTCVGMAAVAMSFLCARAFSATLTRADLFSAKAAAIQVTLLLTCAVVALAFLMHGTHVGGDVLGAGGAGQHEGGGSAGSQQQHQHLYSRKNLFYLQVTVVSISTCLCAGLGCLPFFCATQGLSDRTLAFCNLGAAGMMCAASAELLLEAAWALPNDGAIGSVGGNTSSSPGTAPSSSSASSDINSPSSPEKHLLHWLGLLRDLPSVDASALQVMGFFTALGAAFMVACDKAFSSDEHDQAEFLLTISGNADKIQRKAAISTPTTEENEEHQDEDEGLQQDQQHPGREDSPPGGAIRTSSSAASSPTTEDALPPSPSMSDPGSYSAASSSMIRPAPFLVDPVLSSTSPDGGGDEQAEGGGRTTLATRSLGTDTRYRTSHDEEGIRRRRASELWEERPNQSYSSIEAASRSDSLLHYAPRRSRSKDSDSMQFGSNSSPLSRRVRNKAFAREDPEAAHLKAQEERSFVLFLAMFLHAFAEGIALGVGFGSSGDNFSDVDDHFPPGTASGSSSLGTSNSNINIVVPSGSTSSSGSTSIAGAADQFSAGGPRSFISQTGWSVALALGLHNIPEGMVVGLSLCSHGVAPSTALLLSILSSAPQPVMALLSCAFVNFFTYLLPFGLCFAAGAMLCVSFTELWQEAREHVALVPSACVLVSSFLAMLAINSASADATVR